MSERHKRGLTLGPDDDDVQEAAKSSEAPSGSTTAKVVHRQVRTMTLVAFARVYRAKVKLKAEDLESTGAEVVKLCLAKGVRPTEVEDARFGKIRLYPEWILKEFFKVEG